MFRRCVILLVAGLACAVAACAGPSTPQLIGTYPQGGGPSNPQPDYGGSVPPQNLYIAYNAALELEVDRPAATVYSVQSIAERSGGYLLTSRTWTERGDEYAEASIAVPVYAFESVRSQLRSLGEVRSESVSGELRDGSPGYLGGAASFSNITVTLRPDSANWWRKIGSFFSGALTVIFWTLAVVTPPFLMIVGLITTFRTVAGWIAARTKARP